MDMDTDMTAYFRLLRDYPDFARLWFSQVISLTGDWFNTIVLSALIVAYSPENTGLAISMFILSRFIPPMLISPYAGVLVDRLDRKMLLVLSNLLRAVVVLLYIPAISNPDLLWTIYVLSIIQFFLSAVFEPGQNAIIPSLVAENELVRANTLVSVTWSVMLAAGAAIGGIVATLFGGEIALVIDAITFVVAGWLIWDIKSYRFNAAAVEAARQQEDTSFAEGMRYLRERPDSLAVTLVKFGGSLGNADAIMTVFATQIFVLGVNGQLSLGIMYSAFGIGAVLGPVLFNYFNDGSVKTMRRLVAAGFVLIAVGWLGLADASTLLVICIGLLVRAMGGSANWTYSSVILQKTVPDHYLGRVFSVDMALFYLAMVIGTLAHGALIDILGSEHIRAIAAGTIFVSLLPTLAWFIAVRWLERRESALSEAAAPAGD